MRSLLWMNGVLAFLLVAVALGAYHYSKGPFLPEMSPTVAEKIGEIQDIEHLRQVAQFLVKGNDQAVRNANVVIESGIRMFAILALACAALFAANWLTVLKLQRIAQGRPAGWLKWF